MSTETVTERVPNMDGSSNSPTPRINNSLLNGNNFPALSRSINLFLGARGKTGWFEGKVQKPAATEPVKLVDWDTERCKILTWLFNSMQSDVYELFMFYDTVDGLWTGLNEMYAHSRNQIRKYEIYGHVTHASQKNDSVQVYYGNLKKGWDELAHYKSQFLASISGMTPAIAKELNKASEDEQVYQFLLGLRDEYETLPCQILGTFPLPSPGEAYAMIESDERRRRLSASVTSHSETSTPVDHMAFATNSGSRSGASFGGYHKKEPSICNHCGRTGHNRDRCWKLHPELRPKTTSQNYGKNRAPLTAAVVEASSETASVVPTDINQLSSRIERLFSLVQNSHVQNSGVPIAMTALGTSTALHVRSDSAKPTWVLDSGANDHMTGPEYEEDFWQGV